MAADEQNDELLVSLLQLAQDHGIIGPTDLYEEIQRARLFVTGLGAVPAGSHVLDLGSGGGLPALVIAHDRRDLRLTCIDRREKRTDLLKRQFHRLMLERPGESTHVVCGDVYGYVPSHHRFDAVTARSFGPPEAVLRATRTQLRPGGLLLVAEPPTPRISRWEPLLRDIPGATQQRISDTSGSITVLQGVS